MYKTRLSVKAIVSERDWLNFAVKVMAKGIDQRSMKHMYSNFIFQIQDEIDSKEATILAEQVVTLQGKGSFINDVTKMLAISDPLFPLSHACALFT